MLRDYRENATTFSSHHRSRIKGSQTLRRRTAPSRRTQDVHAAHHFPLHSQALRSAPRACPKPELGVRPEGRTTVIQPFVSVPSSAPLLQRFGLAKPEVFQEGRGKGQRPPGSECCVS